MLGIALLVAAIVACGAVVYAALEAAKTQRAAREFLERTGQRLHPLMDKLDVTVDAVNAELLRVDGIVTRFEEVSERVDTTAHVVQEVVSVPVEAFASLGSRIARLLARGRARA